MAIELVSRAFGHSQRSAVVEGNQAFTYGQLLSASARVAGRLLADAADLAEQRVAFLVPSGFMHVATQWGIWRAGGIAVPLAVSHPAVELAHIIRDSGSSFVITHPGLSDRVRQAALSVGACVLQTDDLVTTEARSLPDVAESRAALIIYTSGTTGKPKGVVTTHANVRAQVTTLIDAWEWVPDDRILLVLPLHHVHGIINVLTCALWAGACCDMLPRFDADVTWGRIVGQPLTLFMAVPTIYTRLIAVWSAADPVRQRAMTKACSKFRVMISGSAALPADVLERWREVSGHVLLERYGMTEIGMALSNPLHGDRCPGFVGTPLPGVDLRLVDDTMQDVPDGSPGEILVRGGSVFREYWGDPAATAAAFHEGWFQTGDVAVKDQGRYRIMGRKSLDIIKSGGYKISALEVEEVLRAHPAIHECAVVGVPDAEWGERVCVAAELCEGAELTLDDLRRWAGSRLAPYKVPRSFKCLGTLPRNAMGKVTKPALVVLFDA